MSEVLIGNIGVDSGQMMLCDPCYVKDFVNTEDLDLSSKGYAYKGEFSYGGACEATLSDKKAGIIGQYGSAAVCATGFGDGSYNVYVTYSDDISWGKRISEMRIVFIGDEVEEEECDECGYCGCDRECAGDEE